MKSSLHYLSLLDCTVEANNELKVSIEEGHSVDACLRCIKQAQRFQQMAYSIAREFTPDEMQDYVRRS